MSTGLLIANATGSVTYSYTAPADSRIIVAYAPQAVNQYININGPSMYGAMSGTTVGGAVGGQWEIFLGVGQTITFVWPSSNALTCIISCIEE